MKSNYLIEDIDGNQYELTKLNDQFWMTSNFKASKFNDGTGITKANSLNEWGELLENELPAYCCVDFDDNNHEMGYIYNHYVLNNDKSILPIGFKLPEKIDFEGLFDLAEKNGAWHPESFEESIMSQFMSIDTWPEYSKESWNNKLFTLDNITTDSTEEKEQFLSKKERLEEIGFDRFAECYIGDNKLGLNIKNYSFTTKDNFPARNNEVFYHLNNKNESDFFINFFSLSFYSGAKVKIKPRMNNLNDIDSRFVRAVIDEVNFIDNY